MTRLSRARNGSDAHRFHAHGEESRAVAADMAAPTPPSPLTVFMPLTEGADLADLEQVLVQQQPVVHAALDAVGTIHYARFLLLDASSPNLQPSSESSGPFKLAIILTYDGDLDLCIKELVAEVGPAFDALLAFTTGASLVPVKDRVSQFTAWLTANDASQQPPNNKLSQYAAYPHGVHAILGE